MQTPEEIPRGRGDSKAPLSGGKAPLSGGKAPLSGGKAPLSGGNTSGAVDVHSMNVMEHASPSANFYSDSDGEGEGARGGSDQFSGMMTPPKEAKTNGMSCAVCVYVCVCVCVHIHRCIQE